MKVYVEIALSLVLHVIPAILALYLACRATADSTAGREGIFKISFKTDVLPRGLPDIPSPLKTLETGATQVVASAGAQVTQAAGQVIKYLPTGSSAGTQEACINFHDGEKCLKFDTVQTIAWLCFGTSLLSLISHGVEFLCRQKMFYYSTYSLSMMAWAFATVCLALTAGVYYFAERVQQSLHGTLDRGVLFDLTMANFVIATLHVLVKTCLWVFDSGENDSNSTAKEMDDGAHPMVANESADECGNEDSRTASKEEGDFKELSPATSQSSKMQPPKSFHL